MAAPTYFGSASVPADGASATNATSTLTITPPASMQAGDLVAVICQGRIAAGVWSIGVAGGQTWTSEAGYTTTTCSCRIFWCVFNGTWSASPRFDSTDATCTSAIMHVFRPDSTSHIWLADVALQTAAYAAPSTPFTVTRAGQTTTKADTLSLACFHSVDDNTWGSISGTGWALAGSAQYRNTAGSDQSAVFAYKAQAAAGATGNVSFNQTALGGDAGITAIITFYAVVPALLTKSVSDTLTLGDAAAPVLLQIDLVTGLVSYWKLDETSGTRLDQCGKNPLTDVNTVTSAAGKVGTAADFESSTSEYLSVNDNGTLRGGDTDFTIALWVNAESLPGFNPPFSKGWGGGQAEYILYANAGVWSFVVQGAAQVTVNGGTAPATGTWQLIICWHDSVNDQIGIQINNGTPATASLSGGVAANNAAFIIGASPGQGIYWDGLIDEVAFYRKALSSYERDAIWNSGNGQTYTLSKPPFNVLFSGLLTPSGSTWVTPSIAPSANKLILAIAGVRFNGASGNDVISISGNGLTWVQIVDRADFGPSNWHRVLGIFRSMSGSTPTAGPITFTKDTAVAFQGDCIATIVEVSDVKTTGTNGADAVGTPNDSASNGATSTSEALLGTPAAGDISFGVLLTADLISITGDSAWDSLVSPASNELTMRIDYDAGQDSTFNTSWSGSAPYVSGVFYLVAAPVGGPLTKNVSDGITMGETRANAIGLVRADALSMAEAIAKLASLLRSDAISMSEAIATAKVLLKALADPMTLSESLTKLASLRRSDALALSEALAKASALYRVDTLTMNDAIAAVRALVRACVDPITMGDNLATLQALLRAYSDAITMGEVFNKAIIMAAYSDTFDRANSTTVGSSWNENVSGADIASNKLQFVNTGSYSSVIWTSPVAISAQYQKATVSWVAGKSELIGFLFRCSNTTNGTGYKLIFETATDTVYWENVSNLSTPGTSTAIGTTSLTIAPGDTIGATLELLGNNTIIRIWLNPTGLPNRANDWNGDTTPNVTMTQNPATARDAGTFIGLLGAPLESGSTLTFDNWFGGGCLESTGQLFSKDLFDGVVVSEALARVATMFRSQADPITISEVLARAAVLQRYTSDSLTLGDALFPVRSLARAYADTLSLGEALAKTAGKKYADAITLGEAFAQQRQLARSYADAITMNESVARAAQFSRSRADAITMGENLSLPSSFTKALADTLNLGEALARAIALARSGSDPITVAEVLARRIGRALADLMALGEAIGKSSAYNRSIADPVTLGEAIARQKQIGKAVADVIALSEALQKVFVFIKSAADPLIVGEAMSKRIGRNVADVLVMAAGVDRALQAARSYSDALTLGETVARGLQIRRSVADAMALGEALQKAVGLARSITNSIAMGEIIAKAASFARARADALTLSEAVATSIGIARGLADSMTLGEALAKSAVFRKSVADLISMADAGTRQILRQLLSDAITMGDVVAALKIFHRFFGDPITMGDAVQKLFVLLRVFADGLTLSESLTRAAAFHRLPADAIALAEAFARTATFKRDAADALNLLEVVSRAAVYLRAGSDPIALSEALGAERVVIRAASDAITLDDVINTKLVIFAPAWAPRDFNIGTGGAICH